MAAHAGAFPGYFLNSVHKALYHHHHYHYRRAENVKGESMILMLGRMKTISHVVRSAWSKKRLVTRIGTRMIFYLKKYVVSPGFKLRVHLHKIESIDAQRVSPCGWR